MDRVVRIEALDTGGQLLKGAEFKFYVNGQFFGHTKAGPGFATLQIEESVERIEAEAIFQGEVKRIVFASNSDILSVNFDTDRKPPGAPDIVNREDPQKHRWGGCAEMNGRRLSAALTKVSKNRFRFDLFVESTDGTPLVPPVRFHLHDTYEKPVQDIRRLNGTQTRAAWTEITTDGTYVVGAQVRDLSSRWIGLEYDLNTLPGLPQRLKDRSWVDEDRARRRRETASRVRQDSPDLLPPATARTQLSAPGQRRPEQGNASVPPVLHGQLQPVDRLKLQRLMSALFDLNDLSELLLGINQDFSSLVPVPADRRSAPSAIVGHANDQGWWQQLVHAMRLARPDQPELLTFAEQYSFLLPATTMATSRETVPYGRTLEDMVRPANPLLNMAVFRERMSEIETRVCRIEYPVNRARGTGFLVGPDLILTNYHVVENLVSDETPRAELWNPADLVVRFDFKSLPDGLQVSPGTAHNLHAEWRVEQSPYSPHDLEERPTGEPTGDELDFALLRLAEQPGALPLASHITGSRRRGWIDVPAPGVLSDLSRQKSLLIVQHPEGLPMQLAIDMDSVIGIVGNGTRLRHRTNTKGGSSGSPCFDADWNWVALHHSGDPKYKLRFNQAILVSAILAFLERRGKRSLLGH